MSLKSYITKKYLFFLETDANLKNSEYFTIALGFNPFNRRKIKEKVADLIFR